MNLRIGRHTWLYLNPRPHDVLGWVVAVLGLLAFAGGCALGIYLKLKGYGS